jgi:hypothetical protein
MPTRPSVRSVRRRALLLLSLTLLALLACEESTLEPAPQYAVGAVEGVVAECGVPLSAVVGARALDGPDLMRVVAWTRTDAEGRYRLDLPSGAYRLELDPDMNSYSYSSNPRDTLHVGEGLRRFDLLRGRAVVEIALPSELEGQDVRVNLNGGRDDLHTLSDTILDGRISVEFTRLRPGDYLVELQHNDPPFRFYLPGTTDAQAAEVLTVGDQVEVSRTTDLSGTLALLSGRLSGAWQQVDAGRPVVTAITESGTRLAWTTCDADGAFALPLLVREAVRLRVDWRSIESWIGGEDPDTARVFDLAAGERIEDIEHVSGGFLIHLVPPEGVEVDHYTLRLYDQDGTGLYSYGSHDNPHAVCNLEPGAYTFQAEGRCDGGAWASRWSGGAEAAAEAIPLEVGPGELREVTLELVAGGRIECVVHQGDTPPDDPIRVRLFTEEDEELCMPWENAVAGEDGVHRIIGLSDGTYRLAVNVQGLSSRWWYPGTFLLEEAATLVIEDHGTLADIAWTLPPVGEVAR